MFDELRFTDTLRMQLAGRVEQVNVKSSVPDLFIDPNTVIQRDSNFTPKSVALGFLRDLPAPNMWSGRQGLRNCSQEAFTKRRAPSTSATRISPSSIEAARTIELALRRPNGPFHFEAAAFYTYFNGFIFRNLTGQSCEADFASCTPRGEGGDLRQAVYSQRNAIFRGGEFQSQLDAAPLLDGVFGVETQFDVVRSTFAGGGNVPRIPPVRVGGGVFWHDPHWLARVNLLHAFAQNNIAVTGETPPSGYNLLKAEISYTTKLPPGDFLGRELNVGVVGNNLLNENIRNSVSFMKDEVLMPGVNVRFFVNLMF